MFSWLTLVHYYLCVQCNDESYISLVVTFVSFVTKKIDSEYSNVISQ